MKYTLLEMVQRILQSIDSDEVNSISDSSEAMQVSSILEDQYFSLVHRRDIPEHRETVKLVAASDNMYPTYFHYPSGVTQVTNIWYDVSRDSSWEYKEIKWLEPEDFMRMTDVPRNNFQFIESKTSATKIRIANDRAPSYYTSIDDNWLVMDSFDNTVDSTLQESKSRALVIKTPDWSPHDDFFIPEIDDNYFTLLINEAKVVAQDELKGGASPVADRNAARLRAGLQTRKRKKPFDKEWSIYGR